MIVCRSCGSHNADSDTFCGSCGDYLEWTGEKLEPPSAKPAVAEPEPQPTPEPRLAPEPQPTPERLAPEPQSTPERLAPEPQLTPERLAPERPEAAALVAPIPPEADPNLQDRPAPSIPTPSGPVERKPQPEAMVPQQARRRPAVPVVTAPPTRRLQPDDLICGDCGEGNPPTRRFCSRCGGSLQTAAVVPTPWWRKLLRLVRGKARPVGSRPRRRARLLTLRGLFAAVRRMLLVGVLLAGLFYAIFPSLRGAVNEWALGVKDRVESYLPQYDPVRPTSVTGSDEAPDHPAGMAADGFKNTFWVAPDAAAQPTLVLEFDRPTDLVRAIVHVGGGEDFQALGRPRQLHLVYFADDTVIGTADVTLNDTPEQQEVEFGGGDGATRVEIQVTSFNRSAQNPGLALSEIELFERQ